jgi:predicted alpha/beta hydrolase family esterase
LFALLEFYNNDEEKKNQEYIKMDRTENEKVAKWLDNALETVLENKDQTKIVSHFLFTIMFI